jgi:hypothetical protein
MTFVAVGLLAIFAITETLAPWEAMLTFWAGFAAVCFGVIDILKFLCLNSDKLKRSNQAIVWIWAVCLAGICVYAISFYVLVYPTLQLIGIVEGLTSWDPNAAFTLNLVKTVLNWHPILFIIGMLIWAFVNSQRREDVTYPAY